MFAMSQPRSFGWVTVRSRIAAMLGPVAEDLRRGTIAVIEDLSQLGEPPDIIHGQHNLETMTHAAAFSGHARGVLLPRLVAMGRSPSAGAAHSALRGRGRKRAGIVWSSSTPLRPTASS